MAAMKNITQGGGKAVYIVPLKALANEKFKEFKTKYDGVIKTALSVGDTDSADLFLSEYDMIFATSEKLDSLIRHESPWLRLIQTIIIDEIHLLNDPGRGPTLEVLITILRGLLKKCQIIALSATIGNPQELATWLDAQLVVDDWRPVKLNEGIFFQGDIQFIERD